MKNFPIVLLRVFTMLLFASCARPCDLSLRVGERVQIPIEFKGFTGSEIQSIRVYRIDKTNPSVVDSFFLNEILWGGNTRSTEVQLTDNPPSATGQHFDYYESYLHNCDLILDWYTGKDTLANFEIIKSKEDIKGCHQADPNIRIDKLSFVYQGETYTKNEVIQITK